MSTLKLATILNYFLNKYKYFIIKIYISTGNGGGDGVRGRGIHTLCIVSSSCNSGFSTSKTIISS